MCGIAGWLGEVNAETRKQVVLNIMRSQSHRGPDASGVFNERSVTLGHVRLSIIDVNEQSNQPFTSTDGRYVIVFNGEIYNHSTIRSRLMGVGVQFRTKSDTEVLIEAYKHMGKDCLNLLEGMFAFVIYDRFEASLFCARDRLGEKPFYYSWSRERGFIFASEMASLASVFPTDNRVDSNEVNRFLSMAYTIAPKSLLTNISQLQPGFFLELQLNKSPKLASYWTIVDTAKNALNDTKLGSEEFIHLFDSSVRSCTTSDVPYGVFLSGGIDSTSVVDSISRQKLVGGAFSTYTLNFSDYSFSELDTVKRTASILNTNYNAVSYEDYQSELIGIIKLAAEVPIADPSFIPLYIVAKAAKSDFKVMLGGDGGDELLLGYETYRATMLSQSLTKFDFTHLHRLMTKLIDPSRLFSKNVSASEKLWRFSAYHIPNSPLMSHLAWRTIFDLKEILDLRENKDNGFLNSPLQSVADSYQDWIDDKSLPLLTRASLIDYQSWLSDGILKKLDSALMFNSVEGRTPFVNHNLIAAGFRLPISEKFNLAKGKLPLRKRLKDSGLSHVCRKGKAGFGIPLDRLFREGLRDFLFDELSKFSVANLFDSKVVANYLYEHDRNVANHGRKLYCLLILSIWFDRVSNH